MKLKIGDVFTIPIDGKKNVYGQIVAIPNKNNFIIVIFKTASNDDDRPSIEEIVRSEPLFLGYTLDAKLYHKHWVIIGNNTENIKKIRLPYFKLGTPPDDIYIVDYKGNIVRRANMVEFNSLKYLWVRAPIGYENALKAYYGIGIWDEDDNKLLYKNTLESIKLVEGSV